MERGTVIEVKTNTILVETGLGDLCEGCAAAHSCAMAPGTDRRVIRMENTLGARVGDEVAFIIDESAVVGGSLLFYLLPAALLVAGVLLGAAFHARTGLDGELASLAGGLCGLIMSVPVITIVSAVLKKKRVFAPRLVQVAGRGGELI